jgi:antagonist of KipI
MKVIEVLAPGLLTTVQDLGRPGFGPMGVSASGAADAVSLRIGNRLVGNADSAAGLEMTLLGATFLFPDGGVVALTGSDFGATLDGAAVATGTSLDVKPGQTLRVGPTRSGARCYLCVRGGIAVKEFLGSASTHLLSGLGGYQGRALRKGDLLEIGRATAAGTKRTGDGRKRRTVNPKALQRLATRKILRVTDGPQNDWFSDEAKRAFYASAYRLAEESNRMGIRLEGVAISLASGGVNAGSKTGGEEVSGGEMISEGVSLGAIQVPESGLPIILFVEQQTTGGYPKIANVISADFHSLGQLRPRDEVRFERVSLETARRLLAEQEELLSSEDLIV